VGNFKPLLSTYQAKDLDSLMADPAAGEEIGELLNSCIPNIPPISEVYYHGNDDSSDDLEHGSFYAIFDEDDLFEKTPKPALTFLNSKKVNPQFSRWTVYG
jgi:hypothetical protein